MTLISVFCQGDKYSFEKDPADKLFKSFFGEKWTKKFIWGKILNLWLLIYNVEKIFIYLFMGLIKIKCNIL